jgi:hypothetical protein
LGRRVDRFAVRAFARAFVVFFLLAIIPLLIAIPQARG